MVCQLDFQSLRGGLCSLELLAPKGAVQYVVRTVFGVNGLVPDR